MKLRVQGHERTVRVADAQVLLRGVWASRPLVVRVIVVTVPRSQLKPWYLAFHRLRAGRDRSSTSLWGSPTDRSQPR
jgi:hypothetical protein